MSDTKWPSGPWTVRRAGFTTDGEYDYGISAVIDGKSYCIAEAFGRVAPTVRPPAEATAHLIRAAPDLYDALVSALRQLEEYEVDKSGEEYNDTQINAALAKARGET